MSQSDPGLFISLDGLDGTGKSTQCRLLADWLDGQSYEVTSCVDPGGTALGTTIRQLLLDKRQSISLTCEMFLFMASRAQLVAEVIQPALAQERVVVSDRFLLANVVYQGYAGGLDVEQLWEIGRMATGGREPDLTLVLDLPVEAAVRRRPRPADRMESRDREFQQKVRDGFLAEAHHRPKKLRVIDAARSVEQVHAAIIHEVGHVLAKHPRP